MANFIRTRSSEHKEERKHSTTAAADKLFLTCPYHDTALSSIDQEKLRQEAQEAQCDQQDQQDECAQQGRSHFMYVLVCADETLYTGYTTDVEKRVETHNAGKGAKYTAARRPVRLLAHAGFETKHEAMSAEYRFKQLSRVEKLALLDQAEQGNSFTSLLLERFEL